MVSLRVTTPRRSRPAMFPRWAMFKTRHPGVRAARPYLKRAFSKRSHMLWVFMLQTRRPT